MTNQQTADELGILLDKLRALPLNGWEGKNPFTLVASLSKESSYFNALGEYKIEARGKNHLPSDHSLIVSKQGLEVKTYQGDGRVYDFYRELRDRLQTQRDEKLKQEREKKEPKRQEERRKFLKFLGIGE